LINYFTIVDTPISLHIYFRAASLPLVKLDSAVPSKEEISLSHAAFYVRFKPEEGGIITT